MLLHVLVAVVVLLANKRLELTETVGGTLCRVLDLNDEVFGQVGQAPFDVCNLARRVKPRDDPLNGHVISSVAQDYQDGVFAGENNLVEVIGGHRPMTVGDYVDANRAAFDHDGAFPARVAS